MQTNEDEFDWSVTTWEGSRRAQLRRWLKLSVRERLEAIEQMALVARRLAQAAHRQRLELPKADESL